MAVVTAPLVAALQVTFNKQFQKGLDSAQPQYPEIATVVPSTGRSNTYGWLGKFPTLREWIGDRVIKSMQAHGYSIENKDFESTVGVDRNDIEDDTVGVYNPIFEEMGKSAMLHPDQLIWGLLKAGFATNCFDGQFFFDTDHPVYPNADGTGTAATVSNVKVNGTYAGEPWYVIDDSRAIKPLILQQRKKPQMVSLTKLDDEAVFMSKQFRYGVDWRGNVGFSFWQLAFGVKDELNADNLWHAIKAMRTFTADGGQKLGIKPTKLVVPPSLEDVATKLLERELDASSSNELKGRLKVVVADYL